MPFHENKILMGMIRKIIKELNVSDFIETGTCEAQTSSYVATTYPFLKVYTCEIDEKYYQKSVKKLSIYKNASISKESSEKYIERLISNKIIGNMPLFYLDAHWYDYWPLQDEVKTISKLSQFVILADDFKVPGKPQFENDNGGGGTPGVHRTTIDIRPCSMETIGHLLPKECDIIYPDYTRKMACDTYPHLRGNCFILFGIPEEKLISLKVVPYHFWVKNEIGY